MKVAILKVGYCTYAFKKPGDATKVMELLGKGVEVETQFQAQRQIWVAGSRAEGAREVSLELVDADRVQPAPKRAPESRQLGYTPPLV